MQGSTGTRSLTMPLTDSKEQSTSLEAVSHSASQEILRLLWTRRFITVFIRARNWSLIWAKCIQSTTSHPISLRSILILSSHLSLCLPSGLLPSLLF